MNLKSKEGKRERKNQEYVFMGKGEVASSLRVR